MDTFFKSYLKSELESLKVKIAGVCTLLGISNPVLNSKEVKGLCIANGVDDLRELKQLAMQSYRENVVSNR